MDSPIHRVDEFVADLLALDVDGVRRHLHPRVHLRALEPGAVIGHVGPEAAVGGPIAFIEDGDEILVDLTTNEINCTPLKDAATLAKRKAAWDKVVADNDGVHPNCGKADTRLLHRARHTAVPATRGGGLHPNREVWVREQREAARSGFVPANKYRPDAKKAF